MKNYLLLATIALLSPLGIFGTDKTGDRRYTVYVEYFENNRQIKPYKTNIWEVWREENSPEKTFTDEKTGDVAELASAEYMLGKVTTASYHVFKPEDFATKGSATSSPSSDGPPSASPRSFNSARC